MGFRIFKCTLSVENVERAMLIWVHRTLEFNGNILEIDFLVNVMPGQNLKGVCPLPPQPDSLIFMFIFNKNLIQY